MCSVDERHQDSIEHSVRTLVGQRVIARAFGYADLNDHEQVHHDQAMDALLVKLSARVAYGLRDEEYLRLKVLACMLPWLRK